ncbi:MAG: sigma-70 domain-containing protein [Lachnospiraceae bacterium]
MDQQKFISAVEGLRDAALNADGKITKQQIQDKLADQGMELDEAQLKMVYAYLKTSKVSVLENNESMEEVELTREEAKVVEPISENETQEEPSVEEREGEFLKMYRDDIKNVLVLSEEELYQRMKKIAETPTKNDYQAVVQTFLKDVLRWVKTYEGGALMMSDLIQEGNMGLISAVEEFDYAGALKEDHPVKKLREALKKKVLKAVQEAVFEQESENNVGYKIAGRVNAVNECARQLSEENGRKVTIEEVAQQMEMTYDEVKEIVDLSVGKIEYINYF